MQSHVVEILTHDKHMMHACCYADKYDDISNAHEGLYYGSVNF